ncbi:arginine N-succinyltransferase [Noviherbaspirillum galbum]|uniref:Arginine N-succinyltransferase n=1 Tax=Noviherbaspirillum galbum TaxID=2709383 RepID=A0A6B3SI01_9BURK|nr:arginine N-succinyltransferase [Noviherbaspirillum galbum]NEX60280.1 arginine N-succinyltransferase [Noviherbaspirillum galbum]
MLVVRAIQEQDLDGLLALASRVGSGMTTLKPDRKALGQRLEIACASFAEQIPPPQRDYVFVMEDAARGRLAGVCAIKAAVGLDDPFYNYRIGTLVHSSNELKVFSRMDTLYLSNDLTGCAELCSLFLHPDYRSGTNGKLLSKSRLMFIAQFPQLFSEKLIAEMRGFQGPDGKSPFWDSLGHHFFKMDFDRADDLTALGKKSFIAELMPRHPLYVAYLPKEAQEVIGVVHADTVPARRLLEQEGLHYEGYVDIFDAGPVLQARISELRALRESELVRVEFTEAQSNQPPAIDPIMIATTAMRDFRVIAAGTQPDGSAALNREQADLLRCAAGDVVRALSLTPRKPAHA